MEILYFSDEKNMMHIFFYKTEPGRRGGAQWTKLTEKVPNTPSVIKIIKKLAQAILCTNLDISCNCQQLKVFKIVQNKRDIQEKKLYKFFRIALKYSKLSTVGWGGGRIEQINFLAPTLF